MPVDSRIGAPVASIRVRSGRFEISPEATFHAAMPTRVSSSTASLENGELRKTRPRSAA